MEGPPPPPPAPVPAVLPAPIKVKVATAAAVENVVSSSVLSSVFERNAWRRDKSKEANSLLPEVLRVVTYNCYFGKLEQEARAIALIEHCLRFDPHVIAIQEVSLEFIKHIKAIPAVQRSYRLCPEKGFSSSAGCWYGVCFLVHLSLKPKIIETTLPSSMGRMLLSLQFENGVISTCHFESLGNAPTRAKQLAVVSETMGRGTEFHLVVGDFNMTETENKSISPEYTDLWSKLYPDNPGLTWTTENVTVLMENPNESWLARCDRMIAKGSLFPCSEMQIIKGQFELKHSKKIINCSDHYGLFGLFAKRK